MRGYLGKPAETAQALAGGHLHTGDVAYKDADGYVFIVDRIKDVILTGGFNVYPRNVEEAIYLHPAVEECVVAGVPDAYRGQAVKAWIKPAPGKQLSRDELRAFLEDKLSHIEMPRLVEFRDQPLPKTLIGKLSRKDLLAEEARRCHRSGGMTEIVIAGYARSPFQPAHKGSLARVRPDELAAQVIAGLLQRTGVDPQAIEDVIVGCAFPEGEQGLNVARLIGFLAGLPERAAATTVNRFCGSSMQAVHMAAGAIAMGAGEAFVCAGVEIDDPSAGHGLQSNAPSRPRGEIPPSLRRHGRDCREPRARTPDRTARSGGVRRAQPPQGGGGAERPGGWRQRLFRCAAVMRRSSRTAVSGPDTTVERLAELKPAFDAVGTVTAGTSSPLTDGASALLVTSGAFARAQGSTALARLRGIAVAGCAPEIMGIGPVPAARKALERAGVAARGHGPDRAQRGVRIAGAGRASAR